ncbi:MULTISPECIES: tyrosine-protein phosphatase [unclassified Serratia (in: enterobacteria)]|uniref:tyrosine-protein phosphatase n=1 Tax=unclassified Serratia (in: enterobacteria) TaxID=2647522 RepID=UPI00307660AB
MIDRLQRSGKKRSSALYYQVQLLAVSALLMCSLAVHATVLGLPQNYHQVSADLYRSAQPDSAQMRALEQSGIKTVLNLRQWNDDDSEAKGTTLVLRRVPMNAAVINDDVVVSALREIRFAQKPMLVHCWHGSDRTGLIVAMYRLVFEHAAKTDVLAELRKPEYGYHESYYGGIARYVRDVDVNRIQQRVFSAPAG